MKLKVVPSDQKRRERKYRRREEKDMGGGSGEVVVRAWATSGKESVNTAAACFGEKVRHSFSSSLSPSS